MKKVFIFLGSLVIIILLAFFLGPKPTYAEIDPQIEVLNLELEEIDSYIDKKERNTNNLKPNNEAKIIWYEDSIRKTPYSLVYLHGFSASWHEGSPVHEEIAKKYGMNLFLSRLYGHGVDSDENFSDLNPAQLMESAKEAIAIGNLIGDSTIVMSCSTGGTYSIFLAAHNPSFFHSQILYSPNIELFDESAKLLTGPWGRQLAHAILGEDRVVQSSIGTYKETITTYRYKTEGIVALQALLDETMKDEVFEKVKTPSMIGYYYKSDSAMDSVVSVAAMRRFMSAASIPSDQLLDMPFSDVGDHVVPGDYQSKDIPGVIRETERFLEDYLEIQPVRNDLENVLEN